MNAQTYECPICGLPLRLGSLVTHAGSDRCVQRKRLNPYHHPTLGPEMMRIADDTRRLLRRMKATCTPRHASGLREQLDAASEEAKVLPESVVELAERNRRLRASLERKGGE